MPTIMNLVLHGGHDSLLPPVSPNPFTDSGALSEATLLDILYTSLSPTVAILIDLRTSFYPFQEMNTGVLIFRNVSSIVITPRKSKSPYVWIIGDTFTERDNEHVTFRVEGIMTSDNAIIEAETAEFSVGFVGGIGEVAVAIDDDTAAYFQTLPNWESEISVSSAAFM